MKYVHLLMLWLLMACGVHAQPRTLALTADTQRISSAGALSFLQATADGNPAETDPTRMAGMATWRPLSADVNIGFSPDVIWLKLTLARDEAAPEDWVLNFDKALIDSVQVFYRWEGASSTGAWTHLLAGKDVRNPAFPLRLQAGETTVLIRLQSTNTLTSTVSLWQRDAFDDQSRRDVLYHGLYFGACILLMLLHGLLWHITKEPQNGWYLLYVVSVSFTQMLVKGMLQWMFHLPMQVSQPLLMACLCLSLLSGARLIVQQLGLASVWPRASRLFEHSIVVVCAVCVALMLAGHYSLGMGLIQYANLVYLAIMVGVAISLRNRVSTVAWFFVFSFGIYMVADGISFMRRLGVMPSNDFTLMVFPLGSLLNLIGISILLNFQLAMLRRRAAQAQDQAVQAMHTLNERLEAEVAARTAELREALATERRIKEEQRNFVAMVSHEFHTPLAIINMTAQQIARSVRAPWSDVEGYCVNLRTTVRRMQELVDHYLAVDRLHETSALSLRPYSVPELVNELVPQWPQGRLTVTLEPVPEPFVCDPGLLKIALQNLLSNADRHAPPEGAIALQVRAEVRSLEKGVLFEVRNGGQAIPPEEVPRLFQKYFRGRLAQQRSGAGLGLHLVQQIAQAHGGAAWLESAGRDAPITFCLWVPVRGSAGAGK